MTVRALKLPLLLLALAACDNKAEIKETATDDAVAPVVAEVAAADEYGLFTDPVRAVAFWTHPTLAFNGLALAATASGVVAFNIEDGAEVAKLDGIRATGVSVSYTGRGAAAQGYAVISIEDGEAGSIGVFAIDNTSRDLVSGSSLFIPGSTENNGFCVGRNDAGDQLVVYQMRANGWSTTALAVSDGASAPSPEKFTPHRGGFVRCVADDLDGSVFAVNAKGELYRIDKNGAIGAQAFARSGVKNPAGLGLALSGLVAGAPTEECCGQIYLLDGAAARVHVFDRDDGSALGVIRLAASFDVDGVSEATAMGVGTGNFGAVYRDGALALATNGASPALRLAPLSAVMDALSRPLGPALDPRQIGVPVEDDEPGLDIAAPDPFNP